MGQGAGGGDGEGGEGRAREFSRLKGLKGLKIKPFSRLFSEYLQVLNKR